MSFGEYLKRLLRPLGIYKLENSLSGAELDAIGSAFDGAEAYINGALNGLNPENGELSPMEELLPIVNFKADEAERRSAVRVLLTKSASDKASLEEMLDACGLTAEITEGEDPFTATLRFNDIRGELSDTELEVCRSVMPAHMVLRFVCDGLTWDRAEALFQTWDEFDNCGYTADDLMKLE